VDNFTDESQCLLAYNNCHSSDVKAKFDEIRFPSPKGQPLLTAVMPAFRQTNKGGLP
jgi:hypothetical protein